MTSKMGREELQGIIEGLAAFDPYRYFPGLQNRHRERCIFCGVEMGTEVKPAEHGDGCIWWLARNFVWVNDR